MKIVKVIVAITVGLALGMIGFAILGLPANIPLWRWMIGCGFIGSAILVWDRWA